MHALRLCDRLGPPFTEGEFVSVSAGHAQVCGVRVDATLGCLGGYGGFVPQGELEGEFVSVAVGSDRACAVRVGGQVVCWDDDESGDKYGQSPPPEGMFRAVAGGDLFFCGSASMVRSSAGAFATLETSSRATSRTARPTTGRGAGTRTGGDGPGGRSRRWDVGFYDDEICALRVSGDVVCWNNGSATHEPPGGTFVAVDAGATATCGLRPDGEVECWGFDAADGRPRPLDWDPPAGPFCGGQRRSWFRCAPTAKWRAGAAARFATRLTAMQLSASGEIRRRLQPPAGAVRRRQRRRRVHLRSARRRRRGLLGYARRPLQNDPPEGPFTAIRAGSGNTCGLRPNGDAVCWNTKDGTQTTLSGAFTTLTGGDPLACGSRPGGNFRLRQHRQHPQPPRPRHCLPRRRRHDQSRLRPRPPRADHLLAGQPALARTNPTRAVHHHHRRRAALLRTAPRRDGRMLDTPLAPSADPART